MLDKPNPLGRQPVAMIYIDVPVEASPFHSDDELEAILQEAVGKVTFPADARVNAAIGFVPDPRQEMKMLNIQDGFYEEPEPERFTVPPSE